MEALSTHSFKIKSSDVDRVISEMQRIRKEKNLPIGREFKGMFSPVRRTVEQLLLDECEIVEIIENYKFYTDGKDDWCIGHTITSFDRHYDKWNALRLADKTPSLINSSNKKQKTNTKPSEQIKSDPNLVSQIEMSLHRER